MKMAMLTLVFGIRNGEDIPSQTYFSDAKYDPIGTTAMSSENMVNLSRTELSISSSQHSDRQTLGTESQD